MVRVPEQSAMHPGSGRGPLFPGTHLHAQVVLGQPGAPLPLDDDGCTLAGPKGPVRPPFLLSQLTQLARPLTRDALRNRVRKPRGDRPVAG